MGFESFFLIDCIIMAMVHVPFFLITDIVKSFTIWLCKASNTQIDIVIIPIGIISYIMFKTIFDTLKGMVLRPDAQRIARYYDFRI